MSLDRILAFGRRHIAARTLGVPYSRAADFALPAEIRIGDRRVPIYLPQEHGVRVAFVEILLDDCYGLRPLTRSKRRIEINRVLDIGANVGLFGLAARLAFPQATIHCYEPNSALEPYLSHQSRIARCGFFLEAVGRETARVCLEIDADESVHSSSHVDPYGSIPQVALRTALDRLGGEADLVKMDCEGAEWEILKDAESWQQVRFLTMEYHLGRNKDHERIDIALAGIGFSIERTIRSSNFGLVFASRAGG